MSDFIPDYDGKSFPPAGRELPGRAQFLDELNDEPAALLVIEMQREAVSALDAAGLLSESTTQPVPLADFDQSDFVVVFIAGRYGDTHQGRVPDPITNYQGPTTPFPPAHKMLPGRIQFLSKPDDGDGFYRSIDIEPVAYESLDSAGLLDDLSSKPPFLSYNEDVIVPRESGQLLLMRIPAS